MSAITDRISRAAGVDDLLQVLADRISPTDLQSLMLEVFRRRASRLTPATVLARYTENRFVRPSPIDPRTLLAFDQLAFQAAAQFHPIELSPLTPLGTVSSVSGLDQNLVVATIRNTEVVSDLTNVMAFESAHRLRTSHNGARETTVRLCGSHRVIRGQPFSNPRFRPHFRLFGLCTAGRYRAGSEGEAHWLAEHLSAYLDLLGNLPRIGLEHAGLRVELTPLDGRLAEPMIEELFDGLRRRFPEVEFTIDRERTQARTYYSLACLSISVRSGRGDEQALVDGGFTGWLERLLGDRKQRLLISGIGTELACSFLSG
jgi:hypothetical protein